MRKIIVSILSLTILASVLVYIHLDAGILTDEAKYLLSIPYPHPPLLRTLMSWTKGWGEQEIFWRGLFAVWTLQSVWLLQKIRTQNGRSLFLVGALLFLFSPAIFLQSGTIMLVVPAAVFGMIMVCTLFHPSQVSKIPTVFLGALWVVALLSVYHNILFAPLIWSAIKMSEGTTREKKISFYGPILLLVLYSLSHPLALASMLNVTGTHTKLSLLMRLMEIIKTILLAGGVLVVTGIVGAILQKNRPLLLSLFATLALIFLSPQAYYAILLVPTILAGTLLLLQKEKMRSIVLLALYIPLSLFIITQNFPSQTPNIAKEMMASLKKNGSLIITPQAHSGSTLLAILIDGPFGHEWQYYSPVPVLKFSPTLRSDIEKNSQLLICTKQTSCDSDFDDTLWQEVKGLQLEVWKRR